MSYSSANIDYTSYEHYINHECEQEPYNWNFLNNIFSMGIFGVDEELGYKYDNQLVKEFSNKIINIDEDFLKDINKYGNPKLIKSEFLKSLSSPNNLRYIYQSLIILEDIKKRFSSIEKNINILEIGGGYGGLCIWLRKLSKNYDICINNYTIIDLVSPSLLQKKYTDKFGVELNSVQPDNLNDINFDNLYCISNYGFSEFNYYFQKLYYDNVILKCVGGFMVWNNNTGIIELNENMVVEDERPETYGCQNKFLYF